MHETEDDLRALQRLLDESYAHAGAHLRRIFTEDRRVAGADLPGMLRGVHVLHLATVTAACEPRVAPVDGLFFRGRFCFGSSQSSARFRHIRARPQVSGTVTRGEEFAVVVHGRAWILDLDSAESAPFRAYCRDVYGDEWDQWGAGSAYAQIEPERMFTYGRAASSP
jgi:Pyridoxamine 5'-phosphate oxidase